MSSVEVGRPSSSDCKTPSQAGWGFRAVSGTSSEVWSLDSATLLSKAKRRRKVIAKRCQGGEACCFPAGSDKFDCQRG